MGFWALAETAFSRLPMLPNFRTYPENCGTTEQKRKLSYKMFYMTVFYLLNQQLTRRRTKIVCKAKWPFL